MMAMLLSTSVVAGLTGATVRMVDHWARSGLLRPSGQDATGRGSRRRYTFQDVVVLQAVQKLREGNCPLRRIRTAIRYLKAHYPDTPASEALAKLTLLTVGRRVYLLNDEHEMMEVVTGQLHMVWAVPVGRIILETTQRLESLPQTWTESAVLKGREFRISISREGRGRPFVARCHELRGLIAEAGSADVAAAQARQQILHVLARDASARARQRTRRRIVA